MGLGCIVSAGGNKCGACGAADQPCCGRGNGTCPGAPTLGCAGRAAATGGAGTCSTCGGAGQPCCAGGMGMPACTAPMGCVVSPTGSTCGSCGGAGQPCCNGGGGTPMCMGMAMGCVGRGMGNPGTCSACGATGQPCCNGGGAGCAAGNRCVMATCQQCGGRGQPCCPGFGIGACQAGLACNGGGMGMPGSCGTPMAPPPRPDASAGN